MEQDGTIFPGCISIPGICTDGLVHKLPVFYMRIERNALILRFILPIRIFVFILNPYHHAKFFARNSFSFCPSANGKYILCRAFYRNSFPETFPFPRFAINTQGAASIFSLRAVHTVCIQCRIGKNTCETGRYGGRPTFQPLKASIFHEIELIRYFSFFQLETGHITGSCSMRQNTADTDSLTFRRHRKAHTSSLPSIINAAVRRFFYDCRDSQKCFRSTVFESINRNIYFTLRNGRYFIISRDRILTGTYLHNLLYTCFIISNAVSYHSCRFLSNIARS